MHDGVLFDFLCICGGFVDNLLWICCTVHAVEIVLQSAKYTIEKSPFRLPVVLLSRSYLTTWSLQPTPFISSSTSFWYQFLYFDSRVPSPSHHFVLYCFITLLIHNYLFSLSA